ncbi:MAG: nicotinamide mononucleotide transporter [Clostridia bacterium]|nr:nicotinamide mononucleotide transporter [Clostridia bacterium]
MLKAFRDLNRFERGLWLFSIAVVAAAFLLTNSPDVLTLAASLIGVTALVFVAKGYVLGQVLTVVFALFYGVISYFQRYYGEMITYLGMTSPIALMAALEWLRNPYAGTREVRVRTLSLKQAALMWGLTAVVTFVFHFILRQLGNASLFFSTVSIATSFLASYLTLMRSPSYALAYAANDVILIILWVVASIDSPGCAPMIVCFVMFLINDSYGFINWRRMMKRQAQ